MRIALGLSYRGQAYHGWQSQPDGRTVQDELEISLAAFITEPVTTVCAGRTDAGVHGLNQVVHFDSPVERRPCRRLQTGCSANTISALSARPNARPLRR